MGKSDKIGSSTPFIEFMLDIIKDALEDLLKMQNITLTGSDRISNFKEIIGNHEFSRQDYLRSFKDISQATASKDLKVAVKNEQIDKFGDKRTTKYKYK